MALIVREGVRQVSIGAAVGVLIGCAALAAAIPGRRAMAIDPMTAIREE